MNNVLVVVDMQNDFIDGVLGSEQAKAIVPNVVKKINEADKSDFIIFTEDHHCEMLDKNYIEMQKFPRHCEAETDGVCFNPEVWGALEKHKSESDRYSVVRKDTFGYKFLWCDISEFIDYVNKKATITFVGVCTDICVISNALLIRSCFPENRVIVDASCCAGSSKAAHEAALLVMKNNCIDVCNW